MHDSAEEMLLAELDFGNDPPGVLVVRETMRTRIAGILVCLILAAPFVLIASMTPFARRTWILLACAALPVALGVFLAMQVLNRGAFYIALDDQWLRRKWGIRKLIRIPAAEVERFEARRGNLAVWRTGGGRQSRVVLMKDAYSPESLAVLAERLNVWRESSHDERSASMTRLDWADANRQARTSRRLILGGIVSAGLSIVFIAVSWKMRRGRLRGLRILWCGFAVCIALGQIAAGTAFQIEARRKARLLRMREAVPDVE